MLQTKLHIPTVGTSHIVSRTDLFTKLNQGLDRKLILVSAPAGSGKTTLITDWINQQEIPTAWFSLDNNDNDPVNFLRYIISGVQRIDKDYGQSAIKLLKSNNRPTYDSIVNLLINDALKVEGDFLIVLDDFHLIENTKILGLLNYFIENIPDNVHIAILTRSDPGLPFSKLRSQHQLIELRSSDLSFSAQDISILFNKRLKIKLSIDDANSLEYKTEGWIAGVQLIALSLQGSTDVSGFIQNLKGDNRYIMDYLIEQVLKILPDEIKEFLFQASIFKQFSASLCDATFSRSDSQLVLEHLERNNMFVIPLDNERRWYRFHHLFADLLRQKSGIDETTKTPELHARACEWFEQNSMNEQAIEHALKINNYSKCLRILEGSVDSMWEDGLHSGILNYGDILPDELIKKNPEFCLYYSWILITSGQIKKAKPFIVSSEKITRQILDDVSSTEELISYNKKLLGKISVAFAYLYSSEEHSEGIFDYCKTAMTNLSEDDPFWFSWAWFSFGIAHFSVGDLHLSKEAFTRAFEYSKISGNIYLMSTITIRLAENENQLGNFKSAYINCTNLLRTIHEEGYSQLTKADWVYAPLYFIMGATQYMWAELDKSNEYIKIAYDLSKNGRDIYLKIFILFLYSVLLMDIEDNEAKKRINELESLIKQIKIPPFLTSYYIGWRLYVLMKSDQLEQASDVANSYGLDLPKAKTHTNEAAYVAYIRLLLKQYKFEEAELLITELLPLAIEGKRIERLIELNVSYSVLHEMKGNHKEAEQCLIEAMEIASDENLLSYFVVDIIPIDTILNRVLQIYATRSTAISNTFITNLKAAIERKMRFKKTKGTVELTVRETETLLLIAEDLMNQEIADKLFISLNTVKTRLKNIFLKLDVNSRTKAVSKAKELGLI